MNFSNFQVEKPKKTKKKSTKSTISEKKSRDLYEETSGVCTPSIPPNQASPVDYSNNSNDVFVRLAANKTITVDFVARPNRDPLDYGRLTVVVKVENSGRDRIQKVELTMVDTLNAKLVQEFKV